MTASITSPARSAEQALPVRRRSPLRALLGATLRHPVLTVFAVALLVRCLLAVLIYVRFGGALFGDDLTYPQLAREKASGASANWDDYTRFLYDSTRTMTLPLTGLYLIFGPVLLVGQLFVAIFGALTAALTARLALAGWGPRAALFAGLAVALLPSQILWSGLTLKDALVWAVLSGLALVVALAARTTSRRYWFAVASAAGLLFALAFLRQHTLVVAAWAFGIASWAGLRRGRMLRGAVAVVLAVSVPWLTGIGPAGLGLVSDPGSLEGRRANNAANSSTAFVPDVNGQSPEEIAAALEQSRRLAEQQGGAAAATEEAVRALAEANRVRSRTAEMQRRLDALLTAGQAGAAVDQAEVTRLQALIAAASAEAAAAQATAEARRLAAQAMADRLAEQERLAAAERESRRQGLDQSFGEEAPRVGGGGGLVGNARQLPRGVSVMLLAPYPWQSSGNARVDLARAEMLLWYPMLALAFIGGFSVRRRLSVLAFPVLAGGAIVLLYALTEGNFGTAFRHRGEFVWVVALLAAAGVASLRAGWARRGRAHVETGRVTARAGRSST